MHNWMYKVAGVLKSKYFILLPDDIILVNNFIDRAVSLVSHEIDVCNFFIPNVLALKKFNKIKKWKAIGKELVSKYTYVDSCFVSKKRIVDGILIGKPSKSFRSGNIERGSGVTAKLISAISKNSSSGIYVTKYSLCEHSGFNSTVMHDKKRKSIKYSDNEWKNIDPLKMYLRNRDKRYIDNITLSKDFHSNVKSEVNILNIDEIVPEDCINVDILCISNHDLEYRRGHAFKYFTFLEHKLGVKTVNLPKRKSLIIPFLKKINPKLVFISGDANKKYRYLIDIGIPYILVENDSYSIRKGLPVQDFEIDRAINAEAIIFTTEELENWYFDNFDNLPPTETIHLKYKLSDLNFCRYDKLHGNNLVYSGGLFPKNYEGDFNYRVYYPIFKKFIENGWNVHIYTVSSLRRMLEEYRDINCIFHKPVKHENLFKEMSRYQAGFQGYGLCESNSIPYKYAMMCRPNKLWDYLGAGIPTIGYNTGRGGEIYDGKWGVVLDNLDSKSIEELPERLPCITMDLRRSQTIDSDLYKFENLISIALSKSKKY